MGSFNLKIHQNSFLAGAQPGSRWGSLRRSPRPPSRLGRGTPLPIPLPSTYAFGISILGAFDVSLLDAFSVSIRAKPASAPPPSISVLEPGLIDMWKKPISRFQGHVVTVDALDVYIHCVPKKHVTTFLMIS